MSASGRLSFAFQAAVRGPACQRHSLWSGHVRAGAGGLMRHPSCSGQGARGGRWVYAMHNDAHAKPAMQFRSARWTCTATAWLTLQRCQPCGAQRPGIMHNGHVAPCHSGQRHPAHQCHAGSARHSLSRMAPPHGICLACFTLPAAWRRGARFHTH